MRKLLALALAFVAAPVFAQQYISAIPDANVVNQTGGPNPGYHVRPTGVAQPAWSNGSTSGRIFLPGPDGRLINLYARYRALPGAGANIARVVTLNPAVRGALTLAWLAESGYQLCVASGNSWCTNVDPTAPTYYQAPTGPCDTAAKRSPTPQGVIACYDEVFPGAGNVLGNEGVSICPASAGYSVRYPGGFICMRGDGTGGSGSGTPVGVPTGTVEDWARAHPPPDTVLNEQPPTAPGWNWDAQPGWPSPTGVPVEIPAVMNPGADGTPQPVDVPIGMPRPAPGGGWEQDRSRHWPDPTPSEPWRWRVDPPVAVPAPEGGLPQPGATGTGGGSQTINVEVETCGLPGKPACKIDETGTTTTPSYSSPRSQVDQRGTEATEQVEQQTTPRPLPWLWGGISMPSGACSNITVDSPHPSIAAATVNICNQPWVAWWRIALAFVAGLWTAAYCWRRFSDTVEST